MVTRHGYVGCASWLLTLYARHGDARHGDARHGDARHGYLHYIPYEKY